MLMQRALEEGPFDMKALADDAGVSYDTVRSWMIGRRNPSPENVRRIADALRRRGGHLEQLADELEEAAED